MYVCAFLCEVVVAPRQLGSINYAPTSQFKDTLNVVVANAPWCNIIGIRMEILKFAIVGRLSEIGLHTNDHERGLTADEADDA